MMTKNKEKDFDAVKMMREIREKLSQEMQNMTFEEQKAYIEAHAGPAIKRLRALSAHDEKAA